MAKAELIEGLDPNLPIHEAVPLILGQRLTEMVALRKRALNFSDPEGVHDMRVSSRRLRSALRDFAPHVRGAKLSRQLKEIKGLADCLGEVRDDDVAIIALEKLVTKAPQEIAEGLHQLIAEQKGLRRTAQTELVSCLNHKGLIDLQASFIDGLTRLDAAETAEKPGMPYQKFAAQTIRRCVKDLQKLKSSLYEPHRVKPLHKMRIAAKRLRYAVELFAPCWGESLKPFAQQIAKLQASLGELHDCDIWIEDCGDRLIRANRKKSGESDQLQQLAAVIWLLGHFTRLRAKHYSDALHRWCEWENRNLIDELTATLKLKPSEASAAE